MNSLQPELQINELEREFKLEEFKVVINELLHTLHLSSNLSIEEIYENIVSRSQKVIGRDVLEVLDIIKQQAYEEKKIDEEILFYRAKIGEINNKGKYKVSIGEFYINFVLNNPKKGTVTHEIQRKLSRKKEVSLQNLANLIDSIQKARAEIQNPSQNQEISILKQNGDGLTLDSISYFSQNEAILALKSILTENIHNESIKNHCLLLLEKIQHNLTEKEQSDQKIQDISSAFIKNQQNLYEEIFKLEKLIQQKDIFISKLSQSVEKYEEEVKCFEEKCQQDFLQTIMKIQTENDKLREENQKIMGHSKMLETDLEWITNNFRELAQENNSPLLNTHTTNIKAISENEMRENCQYVFKEQLKEAYVKINKLKRENQTLKDKISDLETQLQAAHINSLPTSTEIVPKPLGTGQNLAKSINHEDVREFLLKSLRKGSSVITVNDNKQQKQPEDFNFSLSEQRSKSIKIIRTLTRQHFENQNKSQTSICSKMKQANLKYQIHEYDFLGILKTQPLRDLTTYFQNQTEGQKIFPTLFSSQIYLLGEKYKIQPMGIIISSHKILICNLQKHVKFSIALQWVENISICEKNNDWLIMNIRQKGLRTCKKLKKNYIIGSHRRDQLLNYLMAQRISDVFTFKLIVEKQQNIMIDCNKNSISLSSYLGYFLPAQNITSRNSTIFQLKIKEISLFSWYIPYIAIINQIGIILFQSNTNDSFLHHLLHKRKVKIILPLTQSMEIIQLPLENKIKIVYQLLNKSYSLQFSSYADTKLFKQKLKYQIEELRHQIEHRNKKYNEHVPGVKRMKIFNDEQLFTNDSNL